MAARAGQPAGLEQRPIAVVDIDGVVADVRHRLHYVARRPKDWDGFFAAAVRDPLLDEGAAVVNELAAAHDVVWLSGRPVRCRADTLDWLHRHHLPVGQLLLRRDGDRRPARVLKLGVLRHLARDRRVAVLVDDDGQVAAAARGAGFVVMHAHWMDGRAPLIDAQEHDGRT